MKGRADEAMAIEGGMVISSATTSEGKKKRSDDSSETLFKKSKHENSTTSSLKVSCKYPSPVEEMLTDTYFFISFPSFHIHLIKVEGN